MRPVDRRVHRHRPVDQSFGVSLGQESLKNGVPGAVLGHAVAPGVDRLPGTEPARQVTPPDPRPQAVEDALEHLSENGRPFCW